MVNGKNVTQGLVVIVAAEAPGSWLSRIVAWKEHHDMQDARLPLIVIPEAINLAKWNEGDTNRLIKTIEAAANGYRVVLIVIDTVVIVLSGADEDKAEVIAAFIDNKRRIGRAVGGAHVAGIHHTGKDPARKARGSYVFLTNPDTSIEYIKESWGTKVFVEKQRDGKDGYAFCGFRLMPVRIGTNKFGTPIERVVIKPCDVPAAAEQLTDQEKLALNILCRLIDTEGKQWEGSTLRTIEIKRWREECDALGLSDGKSADAARKAFNRARAGLKEKEQTGENEGLVWPLIRTFDERMNGTL
jgi:hypothetical protein